MLLPRPLARSTPATTPFTRHIQADLVEHLQAGLRLRATGNVLMALLTVLLLRGTQPPWLLWGWLAAMVLTVGGSAAWLRSAHRAPAEPAEAASRLRAFMWVEGGIGLSWMLGEVGLLMGADTWHRSIIFLFVNLWFAAMTQSLSAYPRALYAAYVPMAAGVFTVVLVRPGPNAVPAALVVSAWVVVILIFTHEFHRRLVASLHLRHQADALTAALQVEKDRALALSQSRSRFLAAASHDLRQPVHAIGLFAATLQRRLQQSAEEPLARNLTRAVDGLERSFNALLDLSRLDGGALVPKPQTFPLRDMFRRLHMQ